jgi:calcium-translocating P-type ATPase
MAVPEGLPLMIAIVSALNMGKMLRDNVLVRKIAGIETAGSLNILFSDKTGTITRGKLETVAFIDGAGKEYSRYADIAGELRQLLSLSILHNTGAVMSEEKIVGGNATERALMSFISDRASAAFKVSVANRVPFNSTEKYSAAQVRGDYQMILLKGAPEKLLAKCKFYHDETGAKKPLIDADIITQKIDDLAGRAIRVLALATVATAETEWREDALLENELTLVGIVGIRDEVRPEAVSAIAEVQYAGVQVVMITGDRHDTAVAIAREAGLLDTPNAVMLTSDELAAKSDEEIKKQLPDLRVIARALPSDKSRLVRLAQELDLVVGMTGDGVNDSPALKKADVGFAMGGGSEVAKEASEIVILDDNFSSIDKAILYGRTIFNSVRKFIVFQLTINVAAVLICFICPLLGRENPLSIVQILWINLVMDTLAAMAFGGEPALKRYMQEKPKQRRESVVSGAMWQAILTGSLLTFGLSLFFLLSATAKGIFRVGADKADVYLLTGYFAFFIFIAVFNAFNARTDKLNLLDNISGNRGFLWVMALIVVVQVLLIYFGGVVLNCFGLTAPEWAFVLGLAVLIIPIDLARKALAIRGA